MKRDPSATRYEAEGSFMMRSPLLPVEVFSALENNTEDRRARMLDLLKRPLVRDAIDHSAPGLVDLFELPADADATPKRLAKGLKHERSVRRYLTRMSSRPTPYGMMAGVSFHEFAAGPLPALTAAAPTILLRPDMAWVFALIEALESNPAALERTTMRWNALAYPSGDRIVLPDSNVHGSADHTSVRVRATPPARNVMEQAARGAVKLSSLHVELRAAYGNGRNEAKIAKFVDELVRLRYLVADTRPKILTSDFIADLEELLAPFDDLTGPVDVRAILPVLASMKSARTANDFRTIRKRLTDAVPGFEGEAIEAHMAIPADDGTLPVSMGDAIADAVGFTDRIGGAVGDGSLELEEVLRRYHAEFLDAYGTNTAIPILEVLDDTRGIGVPAHYRPTESDPRVLTRTAQLTQYERVLLDILNEIWRDGQCEVEIDADLERRLVRAAPPVDPARKPQPAIDVFAQVAISDEGDWQVVLNSLSVAHGGAAFGRFLHMAPAATQERIATLQRAREAAEDPDVLVAEVVYVPSITRGANVAIRAATHRFEIPINSGRVNPGAETITVDDVHVYSTGDRFHLWSKAHGQEIVTAENHLLTQTAAPDAVRLMGEISESRYRPLGAFSWGLFEESLYLPRVVRGRVVLRPAEWNLVSELFDTESDAAEGQLETWIEKWNVPRRVYLVEDDRRLLIDLTTIDGRAEIITRMKTVRTTRLQELNPSFDQMWLKDPDGNTYVSEIVVPVVHSDLVTTDTRVHTSSGRAPVTHPFIPARVQRHQIGEDWVVVKVYAPTELHSEILTTQVPRLIATLDEEQTCDRWFFIRYADPKPHLRFRFRAREHTEGLAEQISAWSRSVVDAGLAARFTSEQFSPEIARYGGEDSYDAVEALFAASSEAVIASLRNNVTGVDSRVLCVLYLEHLFTHWGFTLDERVELAESMNAHNDMTGLAKDVFRPNRDYLLQNLATYSAAEPGLLSDGNLAKILDAQVPAIRTASDAIRRARREGRLVGNEFDICRSVAHMAHNRIANPTVAAEAECYALWTLSLNALRGQRTAAHVS
jgi:thiopeptide-type bacteriocin biosynthesis protein